MGGRIWLWIYGMMGVLTIILLISLLAGRPATPYEATEPDSTATPPVDTSMSASQTPTLPRHTDTVLTISGHKLEVRYPQSTPTATLVLLPGWNYSRTDWCDNSSVCEKALAKGYILVLPAMRQSIYADKYYPETQAFFKNHPLRGWFQKAVVGKLQREFGILKPGQPNFLMGLSTGGRGAAMLALENPELYTAAATLSGDFDPNLEPEEKLMTQMYGSQQDFPERWNGSHNIRLRAKKGEYKVPTYIGHGTEDNIVPIQQSESFAATLKTQPVWKQCKLHLAEGYKHDYKYWDSEVEPVLAFFEQFRQ